MPKPQKGVWLSSGSKGALGINLRNFSESCLSRSSESNSINFILIPIFILVTVIIIII